MVRAVRVLSSPNKTLFWDAGMLSDSLWGRSDGGCTPTPFAHALWASHSSQSSGSKPLANHTWESWTAKRIGRYDPSTGACGVGYCARPLSTLSDPRETSGPRIDRILPARLTTSAPRIKKLTFSPPNKCPIDLFGPASNRTILKRLHVAFHHSNHLNGFLEYRARPLSRHSC